jgi:hypothetical protein
MNYLTSITKKIVKGTVYPPEIYLAHPQVPILAVYIILKPKARALIVTA